MAPAGKETVCGIEYEVYPVPENGNLVYNTVIFNCNSLQLNEVVIFVNRDYYFVAGIDGLTETLADGSAIESEYNMTIAKMGGIINNLSASAKISLDEPRCAFVNFMDIPKMPEAKGVNYEGTMEFFDGAGNYFKKNVIVNAQGTSSLLHPKKNVSIDIYDDEWIGDKTPDIAFGDWVKQDGFHLKSYYTDYFRGLAVVSYRIFDQTVSDRGDMALPWQRAGVEGADKAAKCHPDGFPVMVYFNGEFYGVFSWQLKKHRKNMGMDKHTPEHIHLDGEITNVSLFDGAINWRMFEVRNPKSLYCQDGAKYDGDNPGELMGESSSFYDAENPDHVRSATVKSLIVEMSGYLKQLAAYEADGADNEALRREFAERYDVDGLVDYSVFSSVVNNNDGWAKNWQWFTYDGRKWFVAPYDLDMTFGNMWFGYYVQPPEYDWYFMEPNRRFEMPEGPVRYIHKYYAADLDARYASLRDRGVYTVDNIMLSVKDWHNRVGEDNYVQEYARWSESYCNRDRIVEPEWEMCDWSDWNNTRNWDIDRRYKKGDKCRADHMIWKAKQDNLGVWPIVQHGYHDSLERVEDWITRRIALEDDMWNYKPCGVRVIYDQVQAKDAVYAEIIGIYDIHGVSHDRLQLGFNIVVYSDGSVRKLCLR